MQFISQRSIHFRKLASKYYKTEISNISDEAHRFYKVEELEKNEAFQKATNKKLGGYFELRKNQHIREYE